MHRLHTVRGRWGNDDFETSEISFADLFQVDPYKFSPLYVPERCNMETSGAAKRLCSTE
jgi:hypothetical protein